MADDKVLKDEDDDIEIVEVDELPAPGAEPKKADTEADDEGDKAPSDEDDEDGDKEDARLADHEDDDDDAAAADDKSESANKKKRAERMKRQKAARERTERELAELRAFRDSALPRLTALEGAHINSSEAQIDQRLSEVRRDIETADRIIAKALEAGNGEDFVTAQRLRDEAKAAEQDLVKTKGQFGEARKPKGDAPDPRVLTYTTAWKTANPWYDPKGQDEDSAIVNVIDARLTAEGFNPADGSYWSELTKRVKARLHPEPAGDKRVPSDKKKPPPQGASREHAPTSTRREVYVTPERKAAMIEAGIWDDPQRRTKMLKAYADFDRDNRSAG